MQEILDDLRTRYGFALVIEHHAPKAQGGARDLAPFGSSLWLRWGEIRMSLTPPDKSFPVRSLKLLPFSGSRVEHGWPDRIDRERSPGDPVPHKKPRPRRAPALCPPLAARLEASTNPTSRCHVAAERAFHSARRWRSCARHK
jgi:hypothetical protein